MQPSSGPASASPVQASAQPEGAPAGPANPAFSLSGLIRRNRIQFAAALFIIIAGLCFRLLPYFWVPDHLSLDEILYITNVKDLEEGGGLSEFPDLIQNYIQAQSMIKMVALPPTRCVYIALGWAWDSLFHSGTLMSLRYVAETFSVLSFLLSGLFAYRLGGMRIALVTGALMAVVPVELMLAHRELADGVFAFWALLSLWLLWENMQQPGRRSWLAAYAASIAVMVLTKENAFFAAIGLGGILGTAALFPKLNIGKSAWSALAATVAGGLIGVAILVCLAGGPRTLIEVYRLVVTKAEGMDFAYQSGGGPWYRYVIDLMLESPLVMLPAIGGIFALRRDSRQGIFLLLFIVFSGAVMVNVRNGMNLRYATMWDMPLRFFAAGILLQIADSMRRAPVLAAVVLVAAVGGMELHQYWLFFVRHDIGEPITKYLMYATEIIRVGSPQ